jgi:hypothetical protein
MHFKYCLLRLNQFGSFHFLLPPSPLLFRSGEFCEFHYHWGLSSQLVSQRKRALGTAKPKSPACVRVDAGNLDLGPAVTWGAGERGWRLTSRARPAVLPQARRPHVAPEGRLGWGWEGKSRLGQKAGRRNEQGCESFKDWMGSAPVACEGGEEGEPPLPNPVIHSFSEIYIIQGRRCKPKGQK